MLAVAAAVALLVLDRPGSTPALPGPTSVPTETTASAQVETDVPADDEATAADAPVEAVATAPTPPFVQATLTGPELVLNGIVPNADLVNGLEQAAGVVYSPFL